MLSVNNTILDSKPAADGGWRNVNDWMSMSIHVVGLEAGADTWIEVSNDPDCDPNLAATPVPTGVPITGNLCTPAGGLSGTGDVQAMIDVVFGSGDSAGQAMWSPACLYWNFVRVRKTGGGATTTIAYIFGQVG